MGVVNRSRHSRAWPAHRLGARRSRVWRCRRRRSDGARSTSGSSLPSSAAIRRGQGSSAVAPIAASRTRPEPRAARQPGSWPAGASASCRPASADQAARLAAARMTFSVASGLETIGTCEAFTSDTFACARAAMNRCVAGGIARSCVATRYHDGIVFQAGSPDSDVERLLGERPLRRPTSGRRRRFGTSRGEGGLEPALGEVEVGPLAAARQRVLASDQRVGPDLAAGIHRHELRRAIRPCRARSRRCRRAP